MSDENVWKKQVKERKNCQRKAVLRQIARLLAKEKLITPEERLRFLDFVEKER